MFSSRYYCSNSDVSSDAVLLNIRVPYLGRNIRRGLERIFQFVAVTGLALAAGCTAIKHTAINRVGDVFADGGTTFAADEDPELIKAAVPFSLKLMESLLAQSPRHPGLLFATCSGFTEYAYAFVQQDAEALEDVDFASSLEMKDRARRLYLRARDYGLRGLIVAHADWSNGLRKNPRSALRSARRSDVPLLYWTAVSWAAAISLSKDQPDLVADLPVVEALIDRAAELDGAFDDGAIHAFLITFEMARPDGVGDPAMRAKFQFEQALNLSGNHLAGPYVSYAEAVALQQQDLTQFKTLLESALAVDVNAKPEARLVNRIMQQRARRLLAKTDELFLNKTHEASPK